jgi:hypothetical protein
MTRKRPASRLTVFTLPHCNGLLAEDTTKTTSKASPVRVRLHVGRSICPSQYQGPFSRWVVDSSHFQSATPWALTTTLTRPIFRPFSFIRRSPPWPQT